MPEIIAILMESVIFIGVVWLLIFVAALWHAIGHALGYMLATRDTKWHIRVGWGKRLLNTGRLTVSLLPFDGYFTPAENKIDTVAKLVATLSGGPAASLVSVAGLAFLKFGGVSFSLGIFASDAVAFFIDCALSVNLFILILSVIPAHYFCGKIKGLETDGLQIIKAVKKSRS